MRLKTRRQPSISSPSHRRKWRLLGSGQTDLAYIKVLGWGWLYLSSVLEDYSRYIISWKLCTSMRADDVTDAMELAMQSDGYVVHKPRLLSDNGWSYVFKDLVQCLEDKGMKHSRGAPCHPQTQGKIER